MTKRTREAADRSVTEGLSPLDVLLRTMRDHAAADRWDDAAKVAALAAPYCHAKLVATKIDADVQVSLCDLIEASMAYQSQSGDELARH